MPEECQLSSLSLSVSVVDSSSRCLCLFFSGTSREDGDYSFRLEDVFEARDADTGGFLLGWAGLLDFFGFGLLGLLLFWPVCLLKSFKASLMAAGDCILCFLLRCWVMRVTILLHLPRRTD